jgi:dTMP kinase
MFIVFEGGEGVGKTTQIQLIEDAIKKKKLSYLKTREPGGTPLAEKIRMLFKEKNDDSPYPLTELYLICAARAQHVEKVIKPNLNKNQIILCDRFLDSTYVYQHILGQLPKDLIDTPTQHILNGIIPDLTFIFHCSQAEIKNRIVNDHLRNEDRIDSLSESFHEKILMGYKKVFDEMLPYPCNKVPKRILINANQSIESVFNQIKHELKNNLSLEI